MAFPPIAIIGRGCVLPDALNVSQFNELVMRGDLALSMADTQSWLADVDDIMHQLGSSRIDRDAIRMGGLVKGFEAVFDATGLQLDADEFEGDVITRWLIHAGRQALQEAGFKLQADLPRCGMIMGNLSYPTLGHGRFAFHALLQQQLKNPAFKHLAPLLEPPPVQPADRFSTALPVIKAARALGCQADSFALDAACASSLYAIKLACDRLHNHECELMLAGAVNHSDNLVLHIGFAALGAHSPTGRSLPFQQAADGLLPGEGAAAFALCRLEDARQNGWPVLGLIRGIGLSNDGSQGGFLQPDSAGQARALHRAYQQAAIDPSSISYVECHATGTIIGDRVELQTLRQVYTGVTDLPIGSLKANLGHLITVAGGASLLKVLAAMHSQTLPRTPVSGALVEELQQGPIRLVTENENWQQATPRRAAINAFGFGGSNAHLIVEQWSEPAGWDYAPTPPPAAETDRNPPALAIVSMAVRCGQGDSNRDFIKRLFDRPVAPPTLANGSHGFAAQTLQIDLQKLRTPPADLQDTLGQHILILLAALEATDDLPLPPDETGIYIGMGCDSEMSRHVVRWRLAGLLQEFSDTALDADWLARAGDSLVPKCRAAHILGGMPNMPANRINRLLDIRGPGFTLGAEENSGLAALHTAQLALQAGEIDTAIVGAVDLSCETVHQLAAATLLPANRQVSGDAATVLVLRRWEDARRDQNDIIAQVPAQPRQTDTALRLQLNATEAGLTPHFGHAHACSGLLMVAAAAAAVRHGVYLAKASYGIPWLYQYGKQRIASVEVTDLTQQTRQLSIHSGDAPAIGFDAEDLQLYCYAAGDRAGLIRALQSGQTSEQGTVRLAVVCHPSQLEHKIRAAITQLQAGHDPASVACFYAEQVVPGELAFVFNGIAACYSGVSRELTMAVPQLFARLEQRCDTLDVFPHVLQPGFNALSMTPLEQIFASILYGQLHTEWTRGIAGIRPQAMIGISAGETNSLFAAGVWQDLGDMFRRLVKWDIFDEALCNKFDVVAAAWHATGALASTDQVAYSTWRVLHPVADILREISALEPLARVSIIHSDHDCIVIGQQQVCKAFLARLGARAIPLGEGIAIHTPDIRKFAKTWYELHHWPTRQVDHIRLYSNACHGSYIPSRDSVAEALTQQAISRVDFRPTVEQAWTDGVRIFIEHGARNLCSQWISDILGDRPHLSLAMDVPGKNSFQQALEVVAQLWTIQQPVDLAAVRQAIPNSRDAHASPQPEPNRALFSMPAHMPEVQFPAWPDSPRAAQAEAMPPPPPLPLSDEPWWPTGQLPDMHTADNVLPVAALDGASQSAQVPTPCFTQITAMHQTYLQSMADLSANMAQSVQAFHQLLGRDATPFTTALPPIPTPTVPVPVEQRAAPSPPRAETSTLPGPKWGRAELEILARDKISKVFGPLFERQDNYHRQVRMPMPPLLLADRVTGVDAEPGSLTTGTIWTETDVRWSSWYLHEGHMPAGIMIEAGQADLLLISYLGADFVNRDDRVYRLLGCELCFHGGLAKAGDTLKYEIHIDGHAQHGEVRLFFFHYDCYINGQHRISVRNGQAGFFSDAELDNSEGILWQPQEMDIDPAATLDPPRYKLHKQHLTEQELTHFCAGNLPGCFGEAFALAHTHTRSPSIPAGQMRLLDRVTHLQHRGGPQQRGYLRAELDLHSEHWFYLGHFKHDPCMPGTLMAEGCYQAMAIYLSSLGYSVDKDGWRFEPIPEQHMAMTCRGQATPKNKQLVYEVFVSTVTQHPWPSLVADILCSVDGLKAFHGKAAALHLVPGWPMEDQALPALMAQDRQAAVVDDIHGDSRAMLACAQGRPSMAFGRRIGHFDDSGLRPARLPGPPYLFISRIRKMPPLAGTMQAGGEVVAELDIHPDDWFFKENGAAVMPYCVLLEAALQPCGWLASFCIAGQIKHEQVFRNLDGTGTIHAEVLPTGGPLITTVRQTRISESAGMIILTFTVSCTQGERAIYDFDTVFGFFPPAVMAQQSGLEVPAIMTALLKQPANLELSLRDRPATYFNGHCRLATDKLLMIDSVSVCQPDGGSKGLGALRSLKEVRSDDWFFKAHFFQDPVQPGSLGLEAMLQLLQFYMLHTDMQQAFQRPRFEAIATRRAMVWKYRGQVTPHNQRIEITLDITECGEDAQGRYAVADASLWVDGLHIYHASGLAMRIVEHGNAEPVGNKTIHMNFDPRKESWVNDHRPTLAAPTMPMMGIADVMANAAQQLYKNKKVVAIEKLHINRWLLCDRQRRLSVTPITLRHDRAMLRLSAQLDTQADKAAEEIIAIGEFHVATDWPVAPLALRPLEGAKEQAIPYDNNLFHGPAFYYVTQLLMNELGGSARIDIDSGSVPPSILQPGVLDSTLHFMPNDEFYRWEKTAPQNTIAYPVGMQHMRFYSTAPRNGILRGESRYLGMNGPRAQTHVQLIHNQTVWMDGIIESAFMPMGALGKLHGRDRIAYMRNKQYIAGFGFSQFMADGSTLLCCESLNCLDWLDGTLQFIYDLDGYDSAEYCQVIAIKEHLARQLAIHPAHIQWDKLQSLAFDKNRPAQTYQLNIESRQGQVIVSQL